MSDFDPAYFIGQTLGTMMLLGLIGSLAAWVAKLLRASGGVRCLVASVAIAFSMFVLMQPRAPGTLPAHPAGYVLGGILAMLFLLWQIKPWRPDPPKSRIS